MKILLLHSDFIEWEAKKKAIKNPEETKEGKQRVEEALVVFSSVEKQDEKNPKKVAEKAAEEAVKVFREVKAKNLVVYPYVHLSPEPSNPETAMLVFREMEKIIREKKIPFFRSPFGWYKAFDIKVKGHPLSELSREITAEGTEKEEESEALKKEQELKSSWFILEPNGKMHRISIKDGKISGFDFSKHPNLEKLAVYEMAKSRVVDREPPHIPLMKKLGLVSYEPGSDPGHFRYLPKGKMIKALLEEHTTNTMLKNGAIEVETPIMYDYEHPSLKKYLNRFPARQYTIETPNKKTFLRFSACFGQFLMAHDASISYRNLPLWMYELTRYSFRVEQRGELAGLRRLRAFTMPDCHALCRNIPEAQKEMLKRLDISIKLQRDFGLGKNDLEFALRAVKSFFDKEKPFVLKMVKKWGKPVLLEIWDKRFFYFVLKYELNFVDALDKAAALTTDQIDIENAERYGLLFTDNDNRKKHPIILHLSPSGAIERIIYALLEKAYMEQQKGKNPVLPMWLSPTQVRLCPVNEDFIKYCRQIAEKMGNEQIRADIDDRVESIGKKIRDAELEWVPLIIVVGEKEKKSGRLAVRFRESGKVKQMKPEAIIKQIKEETAGFPYRPLPLPKMLEKRAVFV